MKAKNRKLSILFPALNTIAAVYSQSKLYLYFSGFHHQSVTNEQIEEKLATLLWLAGADKKAVDLLSYSSKIPSERYSYYFFQRRYEPRGKIPQSELAKLLNKRVEEMNKGQKSTLPLPKFIITGGRGAVMDYIGQLQPRSVEFIKNYGVYKIYRVKKEYD